MKPGACLCCPALNRRGQRGLALLLALLIMAMVAALATYLQADFDRTVRFAGNRLHGERGRQFLLAGEAVARYALAEDLKGSQVDHPGEPWAQSQAVPFEGGGIVLQAVDMQGRLNLNNLQAAASGAGNSGARAAARRFTPSQRRFIRLLQIFDDLPLSQNEAMEITEAVTDWLDPDDSVTGFGGAESLYYQSAGDEFDVPGYRPANAEMHSISELRLVKGVTPELYRLLEPFVCALPAGTELNVNTAPVEVLRTLNSSDQLAPLAAADAEELAQARGDPARDDVTQGNSNNGFPDLEVFFDTPPMADLQNKASRNGEVVSDELLSTSSSYFMLRAEAIVDGRRSYSNSLLHRTADNVRVIRRQLGK